MSKEHTGDARLQEAYRSMGDPRAVGESCPTPERLWSAMHGELPGDEALTILDHVSTCRACIAAWRLAGGLAESDSAPASRGPARRSLPRWTLAAAAVLVLGLVTVPFLLNRETGRESPTRGEEQAQIRSGVGGAASLSRERCVLSWTAPDGATSHRVDVTTENLVVVFSTRGLAEPEVRIPTTALDVVPPGSRILWRVETTLLDGSRVKSVTFSNTVD